jgi:hypothetical protein
MTQPQKESVLDADRLDALVRSFPVAVPRRIALGGLIGASFTAFLTRFQFEDAVAKKKRRKKRRKGSKKECGQTCIPKTQCCGGCADNQVCCEGTCAGCCTSEDCPVSQACVDGACGCPEEACAAAVDPTDDQFEDCFCALATDGGARCFANIFCADPPPTCQETSECAGGAVCKANSCQAVSRCSPVCSLH